MTRGPTKTAAAAANEWTIDDSVMHLRKWGTDTVHLLPQLATGEWTSIHEWTVGAARTCALQLDDPTGRISRLHACLVRDSSKWRLRDLGSKNGIKLDGACHPEFVLEPGAEIGIGGFTLIAESLRSIKLREFLARSSDGGPSASGGSITHSARSAWPLPGAPRSFCLTERGSAHPRCEGPASGSPRATRSRARANRRLISSFHRRVTSSDGRPDAPSSGER